MRRFYRPFWRALGWTAGLFLIGGCTTTKPRPPSISTAAVVRFLPSDLRDREGWAEDIVGAIEQLDRAATPERVCVVIATIEQESGYQIDPPVRNLPAIVHRGLERKFRKLGPLAGIAVEGVLKLHAPGDKTSFKKRIAKLKTEKDLDHLFRDLEESLREHYRFPVVIGSLIAKISGKGWLEDFNPVTTIGPMQVKVSYAKTLEGAKHRSDGEVRDLMYTRKFGVRAGTARLLDYEAKYDDVIYRFADFNAGVYSSRNAAFQELVSELGKTKLITDGDLLSYEKDGDPSGETSKSLSTMIAVGDKFDVPEKSVRKAARSEKELDFEDTEIWRAVRKGWQKKFGKEPKYAEIPNVKLDSPKLSTGRSTEWFARSVKKRYERCRGRG